MEKAIKKAIDGGYGKKATEFTPIFTDAEDIKQWYDGYKTAIKHLVLDPLFWQALGKTEEWKINCNEHKYAWEHYWHNFIDHIAQGKDIDSFFNNLLAN